MAITEGKAQIIELPRRGRMAEPITPKEIDPVMKDLDSLEPGKGITNGRFFQKDHQAQGYGKRLIEAIEAEDDKWRGKLGLSVIGQEVDKNGKRTAPFIVAVRLK